MFFWPQKHKKFFSLGLILRFLNLNVLHKGLLMQDWVFRLGCSLYLLLSFTFCDLSNIPQLETNNQIFFRFRVRKEQNYYHMKMRKWLSPWPYFCCYISLQLCIPKYFTVRNMYTPEMKWYHRSQYLSQWWVDFELTRLVNNIFRGFFFILFPEIN